MSDITRRQAMYNIKRVIVKLSNLTIKDIDEQKEINEVIKIYRTGNYKTTVNDFPVQEFIQYYGKIYKLAKVLKLDIFSEIKDKTLRLKEFDKKERLYYYHYVDNNSEYVKELTASSGQMKSLKDSVEGSGHSPSMQRVKIRKPSTNLEELFEIDEEFMNGGLRDLLNLKDDRSDYTYDDLTTANGWAEYSSFKSAFHQTETDGEIYKKLNSITHNDRFLNAKFINEDGREVVINPKREVVNTYPDKGTFNYVNADDPSGHKKFDVDPYNRLMKKKGKEYKPKLRWNTDCPATANSTHWLPLDEANV